MPGIRRRAALLTIATGAGLGFFASSAQAVNIPVTNLNDSGANSLRAAMTTANTNGVATNDTITFTVTGQINLLTQLPSAAAAAGNGTLSIQGPGSTQLDVHRSSAMATPAFPIFTAVAGADFSISGIKISNGSSPTSGGGILTAGVTTATRVEITGNQADIAGPGAGGGASTLASGSLTIRDSTVSGNQSGTSGGGGVSGTPSATVTIERSTISGNSTTALSGAGLRADGSMNLRSTTIASNTGPSGTPATGKNVLVTGAPGILTLQNTIIADAKSTNSMESTVNCQNTGGTITSLGFNIADDSSCNLVHAADQPNQDPGLAPLAVNTQGTPTHAITSTSPALDKGNVGSVTGGIDQRGLDRPEDLATANAPGGDGSDIGAFELQLRGSGNSCSGITTLEFYAGVSNRCSGVVPPVDPKSGIKCKKKKKKKAGAAAKKCGKKKPKKK